MSKRKRPEGSEGVALGMIITPFLDFSFELLFFFIMTYKPHVMEGQWELALPASKGATEKDPSTVASADKEVDLSEEVTVILRTQHDGQNDGIISEIRVQDRANPEGKAVTFEGLTEYLKIGASAGNKEGIKIQADSKLKWSGVVQIADHCRRSGFLNISFAPPPDGTGM